MEYIALDVHKHYLVTGARPCKHLNQTCKVRPESGLESRQAV